MFHYTNDWSDSAVRRFVHRVGKENIPLLFELRIADNLGKGKSLSIDSREEIDAFQKRIDKVVAKESTFSISELAVGGEDIMNVFSLKPSKTIGEVLRYLLEQVIDWPHYNDKKKLLELTQKYLEKRCNDSILANQKR